MSVKREVWFWFWIVAILVAAMVVLDAGPCYGVNFRVYCSDYEFAQKMADDAARHRRDMAREWLGRELEDWRTPCVINVSFSVGSRGGGTTTFTFTGGQVPQDIRMNITGSKQQLIDNILPHEVMHTVLASHFRQPLPRWIDEGICTTVEGSVKRRDRTHTQLWSSIQSSRIFETNRLMRMWEYPQNVMVFYSQAGSMALFLRNLGGERRLVRFVERYHEERDGGAQSPWQRSVQRTYGFWTNAHMEQVWRTWVTAGSPPVQRQGNELLAWHEGEYIVCQPGGT